jgi:antitoxin ParD1/3/4
MNVSLPDSLRRFVDKQVRSGAYSGASDYVRDLIRKDRDVAKLRVLLEGGLDSGPSEPVTKAWFDELRRNARATAKKSA